MSLNEFIKNFAFQFDETPMEEIKHDTIYEEIDEWSSLTALSVIAMIDQDYNVGLGSKEIIEANTVEDLYKIVKELKK